MYLAVKFGLVKFFFSFILFIIDQLLPNIQLVKTTVIEEYFF